MRINPVNSSYAMVPSDTANQSFCGLYVGGAGNISMVHGDGSVSLLFGVVAGSFLPFEGVRINATGTTATLMVGGRYRSAA